MLDKIALGAKQMGVAISDRQTEQLNTLLSELLKWNSTYNLTAITQPDEALKLHILDSLSIVPYWHFKKTLDIGTGPGFPGLPLAIALPDQTFHLLDSNSKKVRFIRQQVHHLGLKNVVAWHSRVENHVANDYDVIVSRAFASLCDMVELSEHLLEEGGRWMAMKGVYDKQEVDALPVGISVENIQKLQVAGLNAERCLIEMSRGNR